MRKLLLIPFTLLLINCNNSRLPIQVDVDTEKAAINTLIDDWHKAAATADEETFFGSMTEDGIYLGTDITERWLRDSLYNWSKKYWERESAWAFTPSNREVYIGMNGTYGWFEEDLDTWMGPCRGSGVLEKKESNWKIKHYHLAVAVANDDIDAYREIIGLNPRKKDTSTIDTTNTYEVVVSEPIQ